MVIGIHCSVLFTIIILFCLVTKSISLQGKKGEDELDNPHRDPSMCEVCKFLTEELKLRLSETGKTKEVLETGHGLDTKKKRKEYVKSELRLIEALTDPHVCDKILEYNIHAERKGSLRFAKGRSETMETLRNLQNKGVKVDLGIPDELWETPSASVTEMQRKCFRIVEVYEEDIEDWYFGSQKEDLTNYLCNKKVLSKDDKECLNEVWTGKKTDKIDGDEKESRKKEQLKNKTPKKKKGDDNEKKNKDSQNNSIQPEKDEL